MPLSCFPRGWGNPKGVKISSGAQQDLDPRCRSSAYPFPELLLLLGLFSHVQLQKKEVSELLVEGKSLSQEIQPPQILFVGPEGG